MRLYLSHSIVASIMIYKIVLEIRFTIQVKKFISAKFFYKKIKWTIPWQVVQSTIPDSRITSETQWEFRLLLTWVNMVKKCQFPRDSTLKVEVSKQNEKTYNYLEWWSNISHSNVILYTYFIPKWAHILGVHGLHSNGTHDFLSLQKYQNLVLFEEYIQFSYLCFGGYRHNENSEGNWVCK